MIVKPHNPIDGQYINEVILSRFESVWIKRDGLSVHVYAGLEGMKVDIFADPMAKDVGPIDTAFVPWPKE